MSVDFLRVDGVMIRKFGPDAALLYALIDWRQARRHDGYPATYADIEDDIGLTRRRTEVARQVLAAAGLLEWEPCGGPTRRYRIPNLLPDVAGQLSDVTEAPLYREDIEDNPPPASDDAPTESHVMSPIHAVPDPEQPSLDADFSSCIQEPEQTPASMANECRKVWLESFTAAHGRPHPSTSGRAFGQIRQAVKVCEIPEDFRDVWRASQQAGQSGEWAILNWIGPRPQSRFPQRTNLFAVQAQADASAGLLDSYLGIDNPTRGELT